MRFVHTADWQLGMAAAQLGSAGAEVRAQRLKSGQKLVARANDARADLLLVAGDLFEDHAVERRLVQAAADTLACFEGEVFILPGNHDPLVPGSVWEHAAWRSAANITVLERPEAVSLPWGTLLPCPLSTKSSPRDPTAWMETVPGGSNPGIRIGLAHGSVQGLPGAASDYPIARDAAQRCGLDYLALGHWHSLATFADPQGVERMAYSGTPEPTRFGERASGRALLVEIDAPGAAPRISVWDTGHYAWERITAELVLSADLRTLIEEIEKIPVPQRTLLEVRLQGVLRAAQQGDLQRLVEQTSMRFFFSRFIVERLRPAPDDDRWIDDLPPGILGAAARQLQSRIRSASDDDPDGQIAGLALQELYALTAEARS